MRAETRGLDGAYAADRVLDMPISEAAFTGFANGAALAGLRPVVEFQVSSLIFPAFDQIVNQAAKLPLMLGGQAHMRVTFFLMGAGAGGGRAGQHSDNPYPLLMHAGIKTVCPATPADAKGLMMAAIFEDDPVAYVLHSGVAGAKGNVPETPYRTPLASGVLRREGRDVTVCAVGHLVGIALDVAARLAEEGIDVEVWDPRSLLPLDKDGLAASVEKTGRLVVIDDSARTCGFGAEVAGIVSERCFGSLKAPIKRITRADVTIAYSTPIEQETLPNAEKLERAIRSILASRTRPTKGNDT
jgi:pyruvate dehydrogenase E1 component beta subunit